MENEVDPYLKTFWQNRNEWLYKLARDKNLGANAVRVGVIFGTFFNPDCREKLRPGYEWLMNASNIGSKSTMAKALKELITNGYLVVEKNHHETTSYRLPFNGEAMWVKSQSTETVLKI